MSERGTSVRQQTRSHTCPLPADAGLRCRLHRSGRLRRRWVLESLEENERGKTTRPTVRVEDGCLELHFRGHEWIILWERQPRSEEAACPW